MGQFLVGVAAGSEGPPRGRGFSRARAEYASGSQVVEVGKALSGESVEQVGLGGADAGRGGLGACAKGSADGHAGHRTGGRQQRACGVPWSGWSRAARPGRLLLAGGGGLGPNGPDGCGLVLVFHPRRFAGATQVACTSGRQGGHLMRSALSRAGPGARPTGGGRVGPDFYRDWEHLPEWHWSERAGRRVRTQHPRHRRPHHPTTRSAPPSRPPPPGPEDDPTAPCHTKPAPPGPRRCTYGAASYFTAVSEQSLARVSSPARSLPSARRERPWRATREGPLGRGAPWRSRPRRGPAGRRRYRRSCRPGHQLTGSSATPPSWTASVSVSGPVTGRLPGR